MFLFCINCLRDTIHSSATLSVSTSLGKLTGYNAADLWAFFCFVREVGLQMNQTSLRYGVIRCWSTLVVWAFKYYGDDQANIKREREAGKWYANITIQLFKISTGRPQNHDDQPRVTQSNLEDGRLMWCMLHVLKCPFCHMTRFSLRLLVLKAVATRLAEERPIFFWVRVASGAPLSIGVSESYRGFKNLQWMHFISALFLFTPFILSSRGWLSQNQCILNKFNAVVRFFALFIRKRWIALYGNFCLFFCSSISSDYLITSGKALFKYWVHGQEHESEYLDVWEAERAKSSEHCWHWVLTLHKGPLLLAILAERSSTPLWLKKLRQRLLSDQWNIFSP